MKTQPAFHDVTDSQMARHAYAQNKRAAAVGHDVLPTLPGAELDAATKQVLGDFGHAMQSTNIILAGAPFDPKFPEYVFTEAMRLFVDVLIGIAGDRTGYFPATDELIARDAGRSTSWVQLTRKALSAYQRKHDYAIVDIQDHTFDQVKGAKAHQYQVHVARLAAIATVEAREAREWKANPGQALATSARNVALPNGPTHKKNKGRRNDAEASINRNLKHARTLLAGVREMYTATGYQVEISLEHLADLEAELKALRALAEDETGNCDSDYKKKVTDINSRRRERAPVSPVWAEREEAARQRAALPVDPEPDDGGVVLEIHSINDSTESTTYASEDTSASVPFMVTQEQRLALARLGWLPADVDAMPPAEAHGTLAEGRAAPPVSTADPTLKSKYSAEVNAWRGYYVEHGLDPQAAFWTVADNLGEFAEWLQRRKGGTHAHS